MRGQRKSAKCQMTVGLILENVCFCLDIKLVVRKGTMNQSGTEDFVFAPLPRECEHGCFHVCGQAARGSKLPPTFTFPSALAAGNILSPCCF